MSLQLVPLVRVAVVLLLLVIGFVTLVSGVRDGIVRRRIRPRWWNHDLIGTSALIFGGLRALVGILCALGAVVIALSWQ